ncbi:hypothetical protein [Paraflavitalea sp. CAU 1676]|uniref:hypothetical protein n=1 Tax=Paraflavitalea sp. CAU 1676 TaxID=3032598 RepID=UPI0023DB445C|nr:hypothetical protein [Paraflavitalea sp. CAU 1676]MDF2189415.1 hypothetical protein [Paraflavitalea sp. CAU 1676]
MKKFLSLVLVLTLAATAGFAQCDKPVVYHSDKQDRISPDGEVVGSKTDAIHLAFTKEGVSVEVNEKVEATATIKEVDCQWKQLYKEGKAIYKVTFQKPETGETSEGSLTIEGKDGQLTILVEMARMEGKKIKLYVSKYEEK